MRPLCKAAARQQDNELPVGLGEGQRRQIGSRHPRHLLPQHRLGLAVVAAVVEVQFDAAILVGVRNREESVTDAGHDVQFFEQFASQRFGVGFGRMALAAGKFPVAFEVGPRRAEGQKEAVVPLDDRGDNDDGRHRQSVAGTGSAPRSRQIPVLRVRPGRLSVSAAGCCSSA